MWYYVLHGIGSRKSNTNKQHNGQKKKDKRTNNDPQNMHIKLKIEEQQLYYNRCYLRWSTGGTRYATLATNTVISHEWGKERIVITTNGTYTWSFVPQILRKG